MDSFQSLYKHLKKENIKVQQNICLRDYTTLHIGGIAKLLVEVTSIKDIQFVMKHCLSLNIPFYVLGRGSNILIRDTGYDGLILHIHHHFQHIEQIDKTHVRVQSGATLKAISDFCIKHHLGGFEFACGIPGSAGGGVRMNAGAYDGEMRDIIESVTYIDIDGNLQTRKNQDLDFGYRHSYFQTHFGIIVEVVYALYEKDQQVIQARVDELMKRRYDKQPMDKHSAGSTFKRPIGNYASALIRQANLQGLQIGDAQVSTKHAGFLINTNHATSDDFYSLIQTVQVKVKEQTGYDLECEIKFLP